MEVEEAVVAEVCTGEAAATVAVVSLEAAEVLVVFPAEAAALAGAELQEAGNFDMIDIQNG